MSQMYSFSFHNPTLAPIRLFNFLYTSVRFLETALRVAGFRGLTLRIAGQDPALGCTRVEPAENFSCARGRVCRCTVPRDSPKTQRLEERNPG